MAWPTPNDYDEAAENLRYSMSDEELRGGQAALRRPATAHALGGQLRQRLPHPLSGHGQDLGPEMLHPRSERPAGALSAHCRALEAARLPFTVPFVYLERGIQVHGQWFPAVKMEWVEGQTLNRFVEESLEKPQMLRQLLDLWPKLAARLRDAGIAHADLQHGNVLLVPAPDGKLALKLIDYDGMYVPALAGTPSGETGPPQLPAPAALRQRRLQRRRGPLLPPGHLLRGALPARWEGANLWQRFNNDDNLLFREDDFRRPAESELFRALWDMGDANARALVGRLLLACGQPLEASPWLDRIVGRQQAMALTRGEQQAVTSLVAVRAAGRFPLSRLP